MATPNLTRGEVRKLSRYLRAAGWTLPKVGASVDVPAEARAEFRSLAGYVPHRVAHDANGYFFTKWELAPLSYGQAWRCICGAHGYEAAGSRPLVTCPTCGRVL